MNFDFLKNEKYIIFQTCILNVCIFFGMFIQKLKKYMHQIEFLKCV